MIRVAINGFGRIGRNVFRSLHKRQNELEIEIVAINDLASPQTIAHLLKYDSVHGRFEGQVSCDEDSLTVDQKSLRILSERNPADLPWGELAVDIVLECTGIFRDQEGAGKHITAGAKKVLISAPSPDPDITIAYGVNSNLYNAAEHKIISCASCTTNCLSPVAKVIHEKFGISHGTMTTIHSYTNDQRILDLPHSDMRRARSAAVNMIPTSTGAAKAVGLVLPELNGKVDGFSVRVPTPDVSLTDFVCQVNQDTTVEEINQALAAAAENELKGVLGYSDEPLVSTDYIGCTYSSVVDSMCTMVVNKNMVKVVAWYDNEMGFSNRMLDVAQMVGKSL